jgi:glycerol uptake facilitator-like aquaporin
MAGLVLVGCYWPEIQAAKAIDIAEHGTTVYNGGVASILCTFPNPNQTNQGFLFFQEFFVDSFIGVVIWACLDPANPFVTPASVPWAIGFVYSAMILAFAANSISTNLARDLGTRMVAAIFFGKEAFTFNNGYPWISILVNIPATVFATGYYEFLMRDSLQKIASGHAQHEEGEDGLVRHLTRVGTSEMGITNSTIKQQSEGV